MSELTAELLAASQRPKDVCVSPDGKLAVYAVYTPVGRKKKHAVASLWIARTDEAGSAKQITRGNFNDSTPRFSPDGTLISFVSDRDSPGEASTIYLLPVGGGEARPLTSTKKHRNIGDYRWSPDGKSIAFTSADEEDADKEKADEKTGDDAEDDDENKDDAKVYGEHWEYDRLRILDVSSGKVTTVYEEKAHVMQPAWSADSQKLAFVIAGAPSLDYFFRGGDLSTIDIATRKVETICRIDTQFHDLMWQNGHAFWRAQADGKSLTSSYALWSIPLSKSNSKATKVAYGDTSCAQKMQSCGGKVVVYALEGLNGVLRVHGSNETLFCEKTDLFFGWDASFGAQPTTVVVKGVAQDFFEVFSVVNGESLQLSQLTADVMKQQRHQTVFIEGKTKDGLPLDGVMYIPSSRATAKGPGAAFVLVHGGPYGRVTDSTEPSLFNWSTWLLSLGYIVLMPNYRGGSGHGHEYANAIRDDPAVSYSDVIEVLEKCISDGWIDADRVAIGGWSYGGYSAYVAVTRDETFHFKAAIAGAGISCWDAMAMTSDTPTYQKALTGLLPWESKETNVQCRRGSPIWYMQDVRTPLLIIHGQDDPRVPVGQAMGFYHGMKAAGKECEMLLYAREGHGFPLGFEYKHATHVLKQMKIFLSKHLPV